MIDDRQIEKEAGEGRKTLWIIVFLFLIVLAGFGIFYFVIPWISSQPLRKIETKTTINLPEGEKIKRTLFFTLEDRLAVEERKMPAPLKEDLIAQIKDVLKELIKGPVADLRLTPVLPNETRIKGVFLDTNGICYLNFSRDIQEKFPGGTWTEILGLYSIVNTLTSNFSEIKGVQILVEGYEVETLSGHVDTRYPLQRREDLIVQ